MPSLAAGIVAAYVQLCQNPAKDWRAWFSEAAADTPDLSTASLAAGYVATCRNPTQDAKAWLAASDKTAPAAPPASEVANYVQLCQNPAKNWRAWLADQQPKSTGGLHDYMESTDRLCSIELYEMQSWMDTNKRRGGIDYLPTGSTADSIEFDDVQPLRGEGRIDASDAADAEAMQARRFGMLQSFMQAARSTLAHLVSFHKGSGKRRGKATRKGKGRATSGGSASQIRKAQKRSAKRSAFLQRFVRPKAKATPPLRPPDQNRRGHPQNPPSPKP